MSEMPRNKLKAALKAGTPQIGCWLGLANAYAAEVMAGTGFDWLLIDMEHAPNDIRSVLAQIQVLQPLGERVLVRPVDHSASAIKQLLDIGVQSLVVPWVETAEQARQLVQAMRYPPQGFRGVGTAEARAAKWTRTKDYLHKANSEMLLFVQIETRTGLDNLTEIAAVEGVDGLFIGPSDLAASLGHIGNSAHPEVQRLIAAAFGHIRESGKTIGIFATDPNAAKTYLKEGAGFVAVGLDIALMQNAAMALASSFKAK